MTGAQLLIRCLEQEGVRSVFDVPGEETLDLYDAHLDSAMRFIPVRHEQAAAFMADVWGRLTGRAGVSLATLGPGATNLTTGLADANLDRAPVVPITGQLARGLLHNVDLGNPYLVALAEAFDCRGFRVESAASLRSALETAAQASEVPALVDCPVDYAENDRLAEL